MGHCSAQSQLSNMIAHIGSSDCVYFANCLAAVLYMAQAMFVMQARLERADKLLAISLNAAQVPDGALRPDCSAEQQAEAVHSKKGSFCRPMMKLARHNSSPACCLEAL